MFLCKRLSSLETMLSRFNDVLQTAADVLAPPPTALQDFEYHWKQVKGFYGCGDGAATTHSTSSPKELRAKCHLSDTHIPFHLEEMLLIVIREETIAQPLNQHVLDFVLSTRPLDLLADLALSDSPPGSTVCILNWVRRFLSCLRNPCLHRESIFQPVQKLVAMCRGGVASPYETDEILYLSTVAGLIRKEPFLINLFLPSHQHSAFVNARLATDTRRLPNVPTRNTLFDEIDHGMRQIALVADVPADNPAGDPVQPEQCAGDNAASSKDCVFESHAESVQTVKEQFDCDCDMVEDRLALLEAILGYFDSPDTLVILRACEGALILATLPTVAVTSCGAVKASLAAFGLKIANRLGALCQQIPDDMDTGDIEDCSVSWGLVPRDTDTKHFVGRAQLCEFLSWLDYAKCLSIECCPLMTTDMCASTRSALLEHVVEPSMIDGNAPFMLVLAAKIVHQLEAKPFLDEIANWLIGHEGSTPNDCLLNIIVENAYDNSDVFLPTMQFIESLLDNTNERILHGMLFQYVNSRGYYDVTAARQAVQTWSDEEDERERADEASAGNQAKSRTLAPTNILKVINNFLLLLPRQIMPACAGGTCYEEYVQDASVHYQRWIARTSDFKWPIDAYFTDQHEFSPCPTTASCSIRKELKSNDSGICEETFYEGPLLRLLFHHIRTMSAHASELNLAAIAILSKLAFLPHPFLHEILLNPEVPVTRGTNTLWTSMQCLARQLLLEVPRHEGFQKKVAETAQRLLIDQSINSDSDENEQLFEAIVVLEEFCKELAAIAFVKYHYATEA